MRHNQDQRFTTTEMKSTSLVAAFCFSSIWKWKKIYKSSPTVVLFSSLSVIYFYGENTIPYQDAQTLTGYWLRNNYALVTKDANFSLFTMFRYMWRETLCNPARVILTNIINYHFQIENKKCSDLNLLSTDLYRYKSIFIYANWFDISTNQDGVKRPLGFLK